MECSQGLIDPQNFQHIKQELAVNFINSANVSEKKIQKKNLLNVTPRLEFITIVIIFLFIPIASISFYLKWGGSSLLSHYYVLQKNKTLIEKQLSKLTPQQLTEKLQSILVSRPSDPRGWFLLGRLYQSQGDYQNALNAFNKAHQLSLKNTDISLQLAELMFFINHNQLDDRAKQLIAEILKSQPQNPGAINLLALDAYQHQHYQQAIAYWEKIFPFFPPESQEGQAILQAIRKAQQKL